MNGHPKQVHVVNPKQAYSSKQTVCARANQIFFAYINFGTFTLSRTLVLYAFTSKYRQSRCQITKARIIEVGLCLIASRHIMSLTQF